jgi:hypothetical protein
MFKGALSDLKGTSDICKCIPKEGFNAEPVMEFLLPGEIPYILLKSKQEEHIFTNLGYLVFHGENATTTRRMMQRFDYFEHKIQNVLYETAGMGMTDRDVELKFQVGTKAVSIDIWKNEAQIAIKYYKSLVTLAHHQARNQTLLDLAKTALNGVKSTEQASNAFLWADHCLKNYVPVSYDFVFQGI